MRRKKVQGAWVEEKKEAGSDIKYKLQKKPSQYHESCI